MTTPNAPATDGTSGDAWIPWLLVMFLVSLLVAVCVVFLKFQSGSTATAAVLSGGAAFAGSAMLCLGVVPVVHQLRRRR
ncbi:hypothetical protein [Streptomyces decoyicus]|uniref:hypothetical protein n=1 Tax=Streptomyces decoyicus TaxID=249567 RepID=UPI00386CCF86|nr:hypothetical protein OG532_13735 [Streptomyces decoyicus]